MQLEPGRLVTSKAGRDRGKPMLVYRVLDDGFVLVVDGEGRSVAKPKRKNPRHLQPHSLVADELGAKWRRGETADDAEVRAALSVLVAKLKEAG
ncbi:MAG: KOW domain-containing RNA-binding protein [Limnochordales bacterium]|jgi:Ribosomal protein L14E/L6E/L27E